MSIIQRPLMNCEEELALEGWSTKKKGSAQGVVFNMRLHFMLLKAKKSCCTDMYIYILKMNIFAGVLREAWIAWTTVSQAKSSKTVGLDVLAHAWRSSLGDVDSPNNRGYDKTWASPCLAASASLWRQLHCLVDDTHAKVEGTELGI